MAKFSIHIKQKEKFSQFSLLNVKEEINQMYDDVIFLPSRRDLAFFVLIFFLGIFWEDKKPFLFWYLKKNLIKLEKFTVNLKQVKRKLKKNEYTEFKEKFWLEEFFRNDTFFVLLYALRNAEYYQVKYRDFFKENPEVQEILNTLNEEFWYQVEHFYNQFSDVYIEDDRIDNDSGNSLDLSKSVSHTIEMRLSKKIENSIKKFTEISQIKSQSPLDLFFSQEITPELVFSVWDQFKVIPHYLNSIWIDKNFIAGTLQNVVWGMIVYYIAKKNASKEKKEEVIVINNWIVNNFSLDNGYILLKILIDNLIESNALKDLEIERIARRINQLEESIAATKRKDKEKLLKKLKIKWRNLVNLSVEIEWDTWSKK